MGWNEAAPLVKKGLQGAVRAKTERSASTCDGWGGAPPAVDIREEST